MSAAADYSQILQSMREMFSALRAEFLQGQDQFRAEIVAIGQAVHGTQAEIVALRQAVQGTQAEIVALRQEVQVTQKILEQRICWLSPPRSLPIHDTTGMKAAVVPYWYDVTNDGVRVVLASSEPQHPLLSRLFESASLLLLRNNSTGSFLDLAAIKVRNDFVEECLQTFGTPTNVDQFSSLSVQERDHIAGTSHNGQCHGEVCSWQGVCDAQEFAFHGTAQKGTSGSLLWNRSEKKIVGLMQGAINHRFGFVGTFRALKFPALTQEISGYSLALGEVLAGEQFQLAEAAKCASASMKGQECTQETTSLEKGG